VYRIAKPMSQYGLDLMCMLSDEVLNIALDAVVSCCWLVASAPLRSTFE
jgi:hypothetical protein